MAHILHASSLCLILLTSLASVRGKSVSCDAAQGWCSPDLSSPLDDGDALSLLQVRASHKIKPELLLKFCPHKCTITNAKSGRRLYATKNVEKDTGMEGSGDEGIGATAAGDVFANQKWFIDSNVNDSYVIKNAASSRRLYAAENREGEDGVGALEVLPIWEDQKWYLDGLGEGKFILRNFFSGRKLYAEEGKDGKDGLGAAADGGVWDSEEWKIEPFEDEIPESEETLAFAVPFAWSYTPSEENATGNVSALGPNKWPLVKDGDACGEEGTQSPINIVTGAWVEREHEKVRDLTLETEGDCATPAYLLNEHTAEVEYTPEGCDKALKVTWLGREYHLTKFNYRSPSEHTFDGAYFPMEVHHVHKDEGGLALIICVMVAEAYDAAHVDTVPAAFLLDVLSKMPNPGDDKADDRFQVVEATKKWNPYRDFIPDLGNGFLTYSGSLTTPPCTTGTIWIIAMDTVKVPSSTIKMYRTIINSNRPNQLAKFGIIVGDADENKIPPWTPGANVTDWDPTLECNNRPIQPLTGVNNPARVVDIVLHAPATPVDTD